MSRCGTAALGHERQGVGSRAAGHVVRTSRPGLGLGCRHAAAGRDAADCVDVVAADVKPPRTPPVEQASPTQPARRARRSRSAPTVARLRCVLAATALMAQDKAADARTSDQRIERRRAGRPPRRPAVESSARSSSMRGGYLAERVTDLRDVRDRIVAQVLGVPTPGVPTLTEPSVIVADDLAPADTAALDLATCSPSSPSSAARPATPRSSPAQLDLPCVVRVAGAMALADDAASPSTRPTGTVTSTRTEETRDEIIATSERRRPLEDRHTAAPGSTADGHAVAAAGQHRHGRGRRAGRREDVEGVGLFRTEVLFLDAATAPTLADQVTAYTRGVAARSATARSSSARWTPAPTSRWPSRPARTRRTRRWACAATGSAGRIPQLLDDPARGARPGAGRDRRPRRG